MAKNNTANKPTNQPQIINHISELNLTIKEIGRMNYDDSMVPLERIENKILLIRGHKVLLDSDLAELFQVETKALNQSVKRNLKRFPDDFMFQLNNKEFTELRSQFVTAKWNKRRTFPYAFTEHGAIMLATVLNSQRAIDLSVYIVKAFIEMRRMLQSNEHLTTLYNDLEERMDTQEMNTILLMDKLRNIEAKVTKPTASKSNKNKIGFHSK
jgi:phage regulator Rha-like protein